MAGIGTLFVELGVNTAAFTEGMSRATYAAKAATQQIGSSLRGIGGALSEIGGEFGALGGVVGAALSSMGNAISKVTKEMGSFGSGAGATAKAVGIGILGMGAAAVTASAAVIGIALHAAEAASHLHELSQATGVSAQELSGLGVIGRIVGVDIDTLAKGLERMDKSALTAAQGSAKTAGAWKTLGISVTDASGHLKNTTTLFGELAEKFSGMEDGATKTALAMQLMGRSGAALIPVLNQGSAAIKYWIDYGTQVGAILTDDAAKGAHNFEQELTKLGLISTGVQNKLMTALLPALDHIVQALTTFASHGDTITRFGQIVGNVLIAVTKVVFQAAFAWEWWGDKLDIWKAKYDKLVLTLESKITGVKIDTTPEDNYIKNLEQKIQHARDMLAIQIADLEFKGVTPAAPESKQGKKAPAPAVAGGESFKPVQDFAGKLLENAQAARDAELSLAEAIGAGTGALLVQQGATEGNKKVTETLIAINEKLKQVSGEYTAAVASGNAKQQSALKQTIDTLHKQQLEIVDTRDKIVQLYETAAVAKFAADLGKNLGQANDKLKETIAGLNQMAAAARQGGQALINAEIEQKLAPQKAEIDKLTAAYVQMSGAANKDQGALDALGKALADANAKLSQQRELLKQEADATLRTKLAHDSITGQLATEALNFEKLSAAAADADTKMILLAQHQKNVAGITAQWDNAALEVGTFGQKVKAVMDQMNAEAQQGGKKIAEAFKTALDGVSTQFADLVVKGKANWGQLFDSLETAIIKQLASAALSRLMKELSSLGSSDDGGGGGGGFFSALGSLFGGGKASGGPVAPGVSYLVGEQGPEMFVPGTAGSIIPNPGSSAPQVNASFTMNIHGATDPDTFKRSAPQIQAVMFRGLQIAAARNANGEG